MAAKIKKDDRVVVLTGRDKGRQGQVVRVFPKEGRLVVSGINMVKRHTRPSQGDPQGGIKHKEAALHRRADPRRLPHRGRQEGAVRQEIRRGHRWLSKLTSPG
jgi:ribosomal protein L24